MTKAQVGFFSFTEVTDPREHRSYNEWHQLDHMPEQYPLTGVIYGQRWVSTPACRAARTTSDARLDPIHYLTLYLMAEPIDQTLRAFLDRGRELHALGRFHMHRRAHLSGPLRVQHKRAAPRVLVSPEAVPYRPNRGVYVVVEERTAPAGSADSAHYERWRDTEYLPALAATPGVAGVWSFETTPPFEERTWALDDIGVTVAYLDEDPLDVAAALAPLETTRDARATGVSRSLFTGPFETITPWQWTWFDAPGSPPS